MRILCLAFLSIMLLGCDKEAEECVEKVKDSCVVTFELYPVCGCNGVTYENPSTAECNGITDFTMGRCE